MVLVLLCTDRYNPTPDTVLRTAISPWVDCAKSKCVYGFFGCCCFILFVSVFQLMKGISYCWTEPNNHTRMPGHRNPISTKEWKEKWHEGIERIWNPEIKGNKASLENNREEPTLFKIYVHFEIDLCNFQALLLVEENPQTFGSKHFFIHI